MKIRLFVAVGIACMVMISSCKTEPDVPKVKNIILLIGDGMGTSQIYAGMTAKKDKLNIERFRVVGFFFSSYLAYIPRFTIHDSRFTAFSYLWV